MEIRAGVDWFAASRVDGPGAWEWAMKGIHAVNEIADEGNEVRARSLNGYAGMGCGGSFVGSRHDGYFVQITGKYADMYWRELYDEEIQVSRIDLQVTIQTDEYDPNRGERHYNDSRDVANSVPESRRWKLWYISGEDGGYTAYLGAPSSKHKLVIYNKDREARNDEYVNAWRYEARFRDEFARKWTKQLADSGVPPEVFISGAIRDFGTSRGVYIPELEDVGAVTLPTLQRRRTDVDTKLRWLRTQVAPSVKWLTERVDHATILTALGLADGTTQP